MGGDLIDLAHRLNAATGSDRGLDAELARQFGVGEPAPDYTASVDRCIDLVHAVMPGWAWHVGWNATGIIPYASLHQGDQLAEAAAPTVPLALLKALLKARLATEPSG
jgi:hypothetical protein